MDFVKAYNKVNWNFLKYMMVRMGFRKLWMKWMHVLILSSNMYVLVNGIQAKEFTVEKGLRKGDPLSTFLFVIVA